MEATVFMTGTVESLVGIVLLSGCDDDHDMVSSSADPDFFSESQNHSHPFNSTTRLEHNLPHEADVRIRIYNTLGREARRPMSRTLQLGSNTTVWNRTSNEGDVMTSGLYFLVLLAGGNFAIREMM